jgi:hypothetical protein
MQLDLFGRPISAVSPSSSALIGLRIQHPRPCSNCGETIGVVVSSCAMRSARVDCCGCGRHSRWLSRQDFHNFTEIVGAVRQPTSPINLHEPFITGLSSHTAGAAQ